MTPCEFCNSLYRQILHLIHDTPKSRADEPVTEVGFCWAGRESFSLMFNPDGVDTLWCYEEALERVAEDVRMVSRTHSRQALHALLFRSREVRIPFLDLNKTLRCNGLAWSITLSRIYDNVERTPAVIGRFRWLAMGR